MSNFLQRVVSAVIRPQVKLQPMQGSIFAPTNLSTSADPISERAEAASPSAALGDFVSRIHNAQESDRASNLAAGEDRSVAPTPAGRYASDSRTDMQGADMPLLPSQSVGENSLSESAGRIRPSSYAQDFTRGDIASESLASPVDSRSMISDQYPALLLSKQTAPAPLQQRQAAPSPQAHPQSARSNAIRRAPAAHREADEIHIHIGHIEVSAIAQAAPRPPAAPARKTVTLDEYLRRGDGRAG
jgi:hypothetical protein